jgi:hypothetical protein
VTQTGVKLILSAVSATVIAGAGAAITALTQGDGSIRHSAMLAAGLTGVVAGAKDVQAYLSTPPTALPPPTT